MTRGCPLLVTRSEPGGSATLARAKALGLDAYHTPLFAARPLPWAVPDAPIFDALLLTSAQAPRHAGPALDQIVHLPTYAVGTATATAATAAGLRVVMTGAHDGQALLDAMKRENIRNILWLSGRDRSPFDSHGAALTAVPCYAVEPLPPPALWTELTAQPAVLLAHSARAADRIAALTDGARAQLSLVAISAAVAARAGFNWAQIVIAQRPDDAAMLAQAVALCHKGKK